jgi:hypothetical protein
MHVHNVSSYAPPGYRLARTSYEGGATKHVFTADGQPDLVCECASQTEEAERAALAAFQGAHMPVEPEPVVVAEAPAKPSRKRA